MKERTKAINKQEQHTTHPSGYCYVSSMNSYRTELAYPDHYLNDNLFSVIMLSLYLLGKINNLTWQHTET